ncbi:hypothetical protein [Bacillus safensis]|nr:hypothetical protein [Bacillus safensis]
MDLQRKMDRLRHTEDQSTTKIYLHITKDRKKKLLKSSEN